MAGARTLFRQETLYLSIPAFISCLFLAATGAGVVYGGKSYSIQVGAYRDINRAADEVIKVKQAGYEALCERGLGEGEGGLHKVTLPGYGSVAEAKRVAEELRDQGIISEYYIKNWDKNIAAGETGPRGGVNDGLTRKDRENGRSDHERICLSKPGRDCPSENGPPLEVQDMKIDSIREGQGRLSIQFNHYYWPPVSFDLQGESPKLVIRIKDGDLSANASSKRITQHKVIKNVQTQFHDNKKGFNILVYLEPHGNYRISQAFNKIENTYAIDVRATGMSLQVFSTGAD